ncbi:hypothetical protein S40293_06674 [Stachybotrys chartarum IBT 40293]|nr:hypothetical protein S40293_06674 [Stachybotrys chartarum IBT 40293]
MASSLTLPSSRTLSYALSPSPPQGPLIILSNSLCAPYTAWDHVAAALARHGFRSLRYDQPGHGDSTTPTPTTSNTFDSMAEDVHLLLQHLGIATAHGWIGVSMGAATGIYFAARYPGVVSRLAVCDTISCSPVNAGTPDPFTSRVAAARQAGHMNHITRATMERWFGTDWIAANPNEASRMRGLMLRTSVDGFEAGCAALTGASFDLRPLFREVGAGVDDAVCIVGEKDANLPQAMEDMRAQIQAGFAAAGKPRDVKLQVIKDAGHVCFIDGYTQFMETIVPFMSK